MSIPREPSVWSIMDFGETSTFFEGLVPRNRVLTRGSIRYFTSPALPLPQYVEGFQGNEIPIDADVVARLAIERLTLVSELDD